LVMNFRYNLIIGKIGDVTNGDKKKNTSEI